jgi:hypothetical protein
MAMAMTQNPAIGNCIDDCLSCYRICLETAMNHCLVIGGRHLEKEHFKLMMACADLCRTTASIMLIDIEQHRIVCEACATICAACAKSCEEVGDMEICAAACQSCATTCQKMADM